MRLVYVLNMSSSLNKDIIIIIIIINQSCTRKQQPITDCHYDYRIKQTQEHGKNMSFQYLNTTNCERNPNLI